MKNFLGSIRKSLDNKNWYSALILSLIIPDICGKLEDNNKRSNKRYPDWFNKYLGRKYSKFLSGKECYALRCSLLHEGSGNIEKQHAKDILDHIYFIANGGGHCTKLSKCEIGDPRYDGKDILVLSTFHFCHDLIKGGEQWLEDVKNNSSIVKNISEIFIIHEHGLSFGKAIQII